MEKNKKTLWHFLIPVIGLIFLCVFLFSCSSKERKLNDYVKTLKTNAVTDYKNHKVPPLSVQPPAPVAYVSQPPRSPFSHQAAEIDKAASPLQIYPLSMLKFVGTVSEHGNMVAYVITPDTKLYKVKVGEKIGINKGTVQNITFNSMEVLESTVESNEKGAQQIVTLQLKEEVQ